MLEQERRDWELAQKTKEDEKKKKSSSSEEKGKKKKKKKKKKKDKEEKEAGGKEKKTKRESSSSPERKGRLGGLTSAKKSLVAVFGNTGLDPDPRRRRRLGRRTKKALKKEKSTSSTSGSGSSTSGSSVGDSSGLMEDRSNIVKISKKSPGLLAAMAIGTMKEFTSQIGGMGWDSEEAALPPILGTYSRHYLVPKTSGGIQQEILCFFRYWRPSSPRSNIRRDGCATAAPQEFGDGGKRRKLADKPEARAHVASRDKHQYEERAADCDQRGKVRPDSQAYSGRQRYRQRKDKRQRKRQGSKRQEQEQGGRQEAVREEEREKKDVLPRRGKKQDYEAGRDQLKEVPLTPKSITGKPAGRQSLPREGWSTEERQDQVRGGQTGFERRMPQKLRRLQKKSVNFIGGDRKKQDVRLARWRKRLKDLKMKLRTGTSSTDALGPTSESVTAAATDCHRDFSKSPDFEGEVSNVDSLGMGQALGSKTVLSLSCCVGETLGGIFMWLDKAADDLFVSSCKTLSTGRAFPLPSSPAVLAKLFPNSSLAVRCTLRILIRSLNSLNGEGEGSEIMATEYQIAILKGLVEDCERVQGWKFETFPPSLGRILSGTRHRL